MGEGLGSGKIQSKKTYNIFPVLIGLTHRVPLVTLRFFIEVSQLPYTLIEMILYPTTKFKYTFVCVYGSRTGKIVCVCVVKREEEEEG